MRDLSSIARVEGPSLTLRLIQPEGRGLCSQPAEQSSIQHPPVDSNRDG